MKKWLWGLVVILTLLISPVEAKETFKFSYATPMINVDYQNVISFDSGYLSISTFGERTILEKYDNKGISLLKRTYEIETRSYKIYKNNIYILGIIYKNGIYMSGIIELDDSLNINDIYLIDEYIALDISDIVEVNEAGIFLREHDKIMFYNFENRLLKESTEDVVSNKFNNIVKRINAVLAANQSISSYDIENDKILVKISDNTLVSNDINGYYLFDEKGNILSKCYYDITKYKVNDMKLVHGHVIVSLLTLNDSMIEIYDIKGDLIDTKTTQYVYEKIIKTDEGFTVLVHENDTYATDVYKVMKSIDLQIVGNGKIEVLSTAVIGDEVKVSIIPEKGYILKNIQVADMAGNEVELNENVFMMPKEEVVINAEFVPETVDNPETGIVGFILQAILIVMVLIVMLFLLRSKTMFRSI